jgi:quercetin dioxygenase-like cupin family protein
MNKALILLPVFFLFPLAASFGQGPEPITVSELLKTSTSWDGRPLPKYPKGQPEVTIARITIQPGAAFPLHKHPMINAGILMSGELTVTTAENKTIHLKAGDAIAEVVNTWHFGKNDGKVPAEILVFYAGAVGSPLTIKK